MSRRCITVATLLVLVAKGVRADGLPAHLGPAGWQLLAEQSQDAVISWSGGRERLVLQVAPRARLDRLDATHLVWLTPVPAPASQVTGEVVSSFPASTGEQPLRRAVAEGQRAIGLMLA